MPLCIAYLPDLEARVEEVEEPTRRVRYLCSIKSINMQVSAADSHLHMHILQANSFENSNRNANNEKHIKQCWDYQAQIYRLCWNGNLPCAVSGGLVG